MYVYTPSIIPPHPTCGPKQRDRGVGCPTQNIYIYIYMSVAIWAQAVQALACILHSATVMEGFDIIVKKAEIIWQSKGLSGVQKKQMVNMLMQSKCTQTARSNSSSLEPPAADPLASQVAAFQLGEFDKGRMVLKIWEKAVNVLSLLSGKPITGIHQGIAGANLAEDDAGALARLNRCHAYLHHFTPAHYNMLDELLNRALLNVPDASTLDRSSVAGDVSFNSSDTCTYINEPVDGLGFWWADESETNGDVDVSYMPNIGSEEPITVDGISSAKSNFAAKGSSVFIADDGIISANSNIAGKASFDPDVVESFETIAIGRSDKSFGCADAIACGLLEELGDQPGHGSASPLSEDSNLEEDANSTSPSYSGIISANSNVAVDDFTLTDGEIISADPNLAEDGKVSFARKARRPWADIEDSDLEVDGTSSLTGTDAIGEINSPHIRGMGSPIGEYFDAQDGEADGAFLAEPVQVAQGDCIIIGEHCVGVSLPEADTRDLANGDASDVAEDTGIFAEPDEQDQGDCTYIEDMQVRSDGILSAELETQADRINVADLEAEEDEHDRSAPAREELVGAVAELLSLAQKRALKRDRQRANKKYTPMSSGNCLHMRWESRVEAKDHAYAAGAAAVRSQCCNKRVSGHFYIHEWDDHGLASIRCECS